MRERLCVAQRMRPAQAGKRGRICGRFKRVALVAVTLTVKAPDLDCPIVVARPTRREDGIPCTEAWCDEQVDA